MVKRKIANAAAVKTNIIRGSVHDFSDDEIVQMRSKLLDWYQKNQRELPWRSQAKKTDTCINQRAYAVWVSEIMLQQTQVATVISYYNKWMKKWPMLQDLANATLEEVNETWSGLGYYSRGRRLYEAAKKVVSEMNGEIPRSADDLMKHLPGVGRYTAGAIASIAYGQATGIVDGNVIRVLSRLRKIGADSTSQPVQDKIWEHANGIVDPEHPGDFNQGIMELGATVCTPKTPSCNKCPLKDICLAHKEVELDQQKKEKKILKDRSTVLCDIECCVENCSLCISSGEVWDSSLGVQNYPRKGKKKAAREERTKVCIVVRNCENQELYCITQRPEKGLLAGLWEFPSLKIEDDSEETTNPQLLNDCCGLEIGTITGSSSVGEVVHLFSHIHQTYVVESVTINSCPAEDSCTRPVRWVTEEEFHESAISTAMKKVFKLYKDKKENKSPGSCKKKKVDPKQPSINNFFKAKS